MSSSSGSIRISISKSGEDCFFTTSSRRAEGWPKTSSTPPTKPISTSCKVSQIM